MSFSKIITKIPLREAVKIGWKDEINDSLTQASFPLVFDCETEALLPEDPDKYKFLVTVYPFEETECYFNIEGPLGRTEDYDTDIDDACTRIVGMSRMTIMLSNYDEEKVWPGECKYPFEFTDYDPNRVAVNLDGRAISYLCNEFLANGESGSVSPAIKE